MKWVKKNKLFVAVAVLLAVGLYCGAWWALHHREFGFPPPAPVSEEQQKIGD